MRQLDERAAYLTKQVAQAFRKSCEERLRDFDLSMPQYAVLRALSDAPGAPAAELARRTFVTRQSLRDVLSGLQRTGLATVADRPTTGRALPVTLTDSGREALERAEAVVRDVEERMTDGIPAAEIDRLVVLLTTCRRNLTSSVR